jgi:WD40-like Beta Propeller Repeat
MKAFDRFHPARGRDGVDRPHRTHDTQRGSVKLLTTLGIAAALGFAVAAVAATQASVWSAAQKIDEIGGNSAELNTPSLDGCPAQSPNAPSLYMASSRPGGKGGLDIWVATRPSTSAAWGAPQNLGEPVNSAADDFCPTPVGTGGLFFVSREALPGACGQGDIYYTHRTGGAWAEPERLLCAPVGPNSALDEQGPSWVDASDGQVRGRKLLDFSRSSVTPSVPGEIFVSERQKGARFGPATAVAELNDSSANDIQPNVRADGLEVVVSSNIGHARPSGHLGRDTHDAQRSVVGSGERRRDREHGGGGDKTVSLEGRQPAPLRSLSRPRGDERHLRDDAVARHSRRGSFRTPSPQVFA